MHITFNFCVHYRSACCTNSGGNLTLSALTMSTSLFHAQLGLPALQKFQANGQLTWTEQFYTVSTNWSIQSPTCTCWMPQSEVLCVGATPVMYTCGPQDSSLTPHSEFVDISEFGYYSEEVLKTLQKKTPHVSYTGYKLASQTSLTTKLTTKLYFTFSLSSIKTQTALLVKNIFLSSTQ